MPCHFHFHKRIGALNLSILQNLNVPFKNTLPTELKILIIKINIKLTLFNLDGTKDFDNKD